MGLLTSIVSNIRVSAPKKNRSPLWDKVRATHLRMYPFCAACGQITKLEVHHIVPFHDDPHLELDPKNLITLCESAKGGVICHLFFGHLGDYTSYNKDIIKDSALWFSKLHNRPK
jgi:5-methylcytosine-specific restriction protein A